VALVVLDTDVASSIVRGKPAAQVARALASHVPCVTFVTVAELTEWGINRSWGQKTSVGIEAWLARVPKLYADEEISRAWGRLSAQTRRAGRPRPINDMWIAACCIAEGLPLATLNVKDYSDFTGYGLELLSLT
jgi:predicted nucleic acid-binding protein